LGKTFDFRDLEVLTGKKENIEDIIDGLITSGFIEEERRSRGDQFTFSSGIVRDVLYAAVPRRKRRALHRKYAEDLEHRNTGRLDRFYPLLVHHYSEGDVPEKVVEFGLESAKKSLEALSAEDAIRTGKIVLEFLKGEEDTATELEGNLRLILADAQKLTGNTDAALQELESAIQVFQEIHNQEKLIHAISLAAQTAWDGRRVDDTRRWVEKGLTLTRSSNSNDALANLLSLAITVANLRGDFDQAKEYMQEAEKLKPIVKEKDEAVPSGGQLSVALAVPVSASHPVDIQIMEEAEILGSVFETLLSMDQHGYVVPCIAERWEIQEKGKSFLFQLRSNVLMHNEQPLTAQTIKRSFEKGIRLSKERLPAAFATIKGVAQFLDGKSDEIVGIITRPDKSLMIELEEPLPIYPALLTDSRSAICEDEIDKKVGTGPFKLASFEPGHVALQRHANYWTGRTAPLESIDFKCGVTSAEIVSGLRSDQIDLASSLLPQDLESILQDKQLRVNLVEAPKKTVYFAFFNSHSPIGKIPELRKALSGILRVQDLVRGTLGRFALPAEGLIPPGILGHDPGRRSQPILREQALELLKSTGLSTPIQIQAAIHPVLLDRYATLTKALLEVWSEIGIEVVTATPNMATYLDSWKNNEKVDLLIGRWNADYDDPDNFTYTLFQSELGEFRSYYSSKELDTLIEEARTEPNPQLREKLYRKIENLLLENSFAIPLFHEIDYRIANRRIKKLKLGSSPPFVNYAELGKSEVAAPAAQRKAGGGVIHVAMVGTIESLDPSMCTTVGQADTLPNIFENLTRQAEGARIIPWLASEFHAEDGGRSFRFRLREDVRFHDGRRISSRDVRYSFERFLQNTESQSRWLLSSIRGAKAYADREAKELAGFKILSALEFIVELEQPLSFFPSLVSYPAAGIVPEGTTDLSGASIEQCIGTGPFRVTRFEAGRKIEMEANPDYWRRGFPKADGLVIHMAISPPEILSGFQSGQFSVVGDLFPGDVDVVRHSKIPFKYRETPQLCTYYAVFNIHNHLSDEKLRHQLIQSIDVDALVRRNVGRLGMVAHSLIPPGLLGYEPRNVRSKKSSTEYTGSVSAEVREIHGSVYDGPYRSVMDEFLQTISQRGFKVSSHPGRADSSALFQVAPEVDVIITRWFGDYPDPDTFMHGLLHSKEGLHGITTGTPEMDRLVERGRVETRPQVRHEIYQEAERLLVQRALLLPLFHEKTYRFASPETEQFELNLAIQVVPYEKLWFRR
jgi:peptide/nickel transport system substrate-binding protein/oligopeptide transport system substrate-binding protein